MEQAADAPPPSLTLCSKRPIKMMPSLMPRMESASAAGAELRDASAEAAQQLAVWNASNADLSLLLRLPLSEFLSHLLFNKSVQRFLESFLSQISGVWEEASGVREMDRCWKGNQEDAEDEQSSKAQEQSQPKARARGAITVLRSLAKRVLLVYVRVCSLELHPTVASNVSSAAPISSPAWLTSLFFTTSFSASSLFSSAALLDLVSFYSSVSRVSHRPLLQVIMARVADKLPYAFGQSMVHAVGVLLGALHSQIKMIHAPFIAGTASGGGKKARFSREDIGTLVTNILSILWTLYSMARVRPDVLRLLLQGIGSAATLKAKAASSGPAVPPFLALLTCLYSLTPLVLQHEVSQIAGKSAATLAAQPDLLQLRKACLKFLDLLVRSGLLAPMGIRVDRSRAESAAGRSFSFALPRAVSEGPKGTTAATTSSPLPTPLSVSVAAETFVSALLLLHSTTHDDSKTEGSACYLAGTPMRNLVKFNTHTAQNAFLKRANEYFEFDSVLTLLLKQAQAKTSGTPGSILGESKITRVLDVLQQIDPMLLKQRCQYPPAAGSSSSSVAKPRPSVGEFDEHKMPSHAPQMSRSASTKSNAGGADPQAIAALRDLFPTYSTDYICACLSEFNNDSELTIKAVLEAKLPAYLQQIRDPSRFKSGDQMDASKLEGGLLSRQSSSGFSSGSGLLDDAVDDADAFAHASSVDPDDGAAFAEFLKRTGRVHKQQAEAKKGAATPLTQLSKAESARLASRIQAASQRFDSDEDEYNDAFDDFEGFAIDGTNPLELEETASLYERRGGGGGQSDNADEPDGSFQKRNNQRVQHEQGQQRGGPNNRPATAGPRGSGAVSSSSSSAGSKFRDSPADRVAIPPSFRPDLAPPAGVVVDVRDQWRRDELRKELYVASIKAQKAQQLAPSKRNAQQEADYQHGLQQGYITDKQQPQQPQQAQPQGQPAARQQQEPRQQTQQRSRDQGGRHSDRDDSGSSSGRGGFSMRGGRGGGHAAAPRGGSGLSAVAASFIPHEAAAAAAQSHAASVPSSAAPPGFASRPQSAAPASVSATAPTHWDSDGSSSGDGGGGGQQQRGGGGGRGGHSSGQSGQSMDLRAKKRKEKNKGVVGNHNRKAGAMRKQAGGGGGAHF